MSETVPALKSSTLNTNLATLVASFPMLAGVDFIPVWLVALAPLVQIVYRFYTGHPISVNGVQYTRKKWHTTAKDFWKSSTFWINAAFLVAAIIAAALPIQWVQDNPQVAGVLLAAQSVASYAIRMFKTQAPLKPLVESLTTG
jgi:anti-sigma-K factor RskA